MKLGGNKYGARKTMGLTSTRMYDSKMERDRAEYLKALQAEGRISDLHEQPKVQLTRYHTYKPDFAYREAGRWVFEDAKGVHTDRFNINVSLWRERGPGVLRISMRGKKSVKKFSSWSLMGRWMSKDVHPDTYDETLWKRKDEESN